MPVELYILAVALLVTQLLHMELFQPLLTVGKSRLAVVLQCGSVFIDLHLGFVSQTFFNDRLFNGTELQPINKMKPNSKNKKNQSDQLNRITHKCICRHTYCERSNKENLISSDMDFVCKNSGKSFKDLFPLLNQSLDFGTYSQNFFFQLCCFPHFAVIQYLVFIALYFFSLNMRIHI